PPRAPPPFAVPAGFAVTVELEDRFADRIATRSGLADARGRELHRFSGLEGEFGEGLPLVDATMPLRDGATARLLGADRVWALVWRVDGVCASRAVFASGFRRRAFLRVLGEVGLIAADVAGRR
ncbi:MAG: hypothetical protein ACKOKE_07565, partial [Actinomycetota bacterium]